MKIKKIIFLFLLINFSNTTFGKSPAKFVKANVHFINGEMKKGKVKIPYGRIIAVAFIEKGTNQKVRLDGQDVEKIDIWGTIYRFIKVPDTKKPLLLLEHLPQESLGLYYYEYRGTKSRNQMEAPIKKYYYFKKANDRSGVRIQALSKRKYKKRLSKYITDCPELIEKFEADSFDPKNNSSLWIIGHYPFLANLVNYYNKDCK
ncbi:MAG: hypothetical protein AB8F94_00390 [Saprospiraceae bacterium]